MMFVRRIFSFGGCDKSEETDRPGLFCLHRCFTQVVHQLVLKRVPNFDRLYIMLSKCNFRKNISWSQARVVKARAKNSPFGF